MADQALRVIFKGEGSDSLVAQYDAIISKQKELEKEMAAGGQGTVNAQGKFDELNESLGGFASAGTIATGISKGLALGLGALGNLAAQAAIEGVTWAVDQFSKSTNDGTAYLEKFRGKAEEMASALLSVESAAGLAITKLNQFNLLRANDSLAEAAKAQQQKILNEANQFSGGPSSKMAPKGTNAGLSRLLMEAGTATDVDAGQLDAWIARLERFGMASAETRAKIATVREAMQLWKAAIEGTTPALVTMTDVQLKQQARLDEASAALGMNSDQLTLAKLRQAEFTKALQENLKITNTSIEQATASANAYADEMVAIKAKELGINNVAKAQEEAAKAAEKLRKAQETERERVEKLNEAYEAYIQTLGDADVAASQKAIEADEKFMQGLRDEIELLKLDVRQREIRQAVMERERITGKKLSPGDPLHDEVVGLVTSAQRQRDIAEIAKKEAEEVERVWTRAADGVNDAWSDFLFDVFDKGKFKFGDFAKSLKATWARALADMIAMSTQQSIVAPLFKSLFGMDMPGAAGGASAFGGAAGTVDIFKMFSGGGSASTQGSAAWMKENVYGPSGNASSASPMQSQAMEIVGSAIKGYAIGKIAGSGTGGAIGGTIGQAVGGPIGNIVGSVIGGIIGGLFKSTPKSISSYGTSGITDSMAAGGLDVKIGKDMANGVLRALRNFADELATGLESDEFLGMVGQRGKKFFYQAQQSDLKSAGKGKYGAVKFDTAEEAISAAIEAAINAGVVKGLTDSDKKLMRAATSVEQAMQDVVASHDFKRELGFQFAGLTSPLAEAQARLEYEYQEQLKLAEKYEADKTQLEAVYAAKRVALVQQYADEQNAALEQSLGGLKDYLVSITGGSASPLSPTTRLSLAQSRYADISKRAKAGDKDAIAELQGASQDYLDASRSVYGSAGGYQSTYQNVVSTLSSVTGVANPLGVSAAANQNTAAAVNDNTRAAVEMGMRAYNQRSDTNAKLDTVISLLAPVASALNRGSAAPVQNGVVGVGTVDWAAVTQAIAGLR